MDKPERKKEQEAAEVEKPRPLIYENAVDYVLNVPIETDEDLAALGQIFTD